MYALKEPLAVEELFINLVKSILEAYSKHTRSVTRQFNEDATEDITRKTYNPPPATTG